MKYIRRCANGLFTFLFAMVILNFAAASPHSGKQLLSYFTTIVVAAILFGIVLGIQIVFRKKTHPPAKPVVVIRRA